MPSFGLYKLPQHHLYGESPPAPRPVFNTMDFQDDEPGPAKTVIEEAARVVNDWAKEERRRYKKKKKESLSATGAGERDGAKNIPSTTGNGATPTVASSDSKKSKNKKKDGDIVGTKSSAKKRKRDSETQAEWPSLGLDGHTDCGLKTGVGLLQNGKTSTGNSSAKVKRLKELDQLIEESSKKKMKNSKSKSDTDVQQDVTDSGPVKPVITTKHTGAPLKKQKKNKKSENLVLESATKNIQLLPTTSPYASTPKKTPIPLPLNFALRITNSVGSPEQRHLQAGRKASEVLVTETPPSEMPRNASNNRKTPIPFKLPQASRSMAGTKRSKKAPTVLLSSPATVERGQPSASAPVALSKSLKDTVEHDGPALTSSNLLRYTQPLNDEPKPRPRGRAASVSSASSMSIKDAFARMSKPSPSSSFDFDPFFASGSRRKKQADMHEKADISRFKSAFHTSQSTVNFTQEQTYLTQYLVSKMETEATGPLPCLKTATGCSAKCEQILRLMRDSSPDSSSLLKISIATETQQSAFDAAVAAALTAEQFLQNAVMARVPVPLAKLEGVYTLYCPAYSATHIDKYGCGTRTLSISRPSGFNSTSHTYTARLSIPPRPMAYTILSFTAPPHASFKPTTLTTSAERYSMELTCLGNGYVVLRVDLALLLTGKDGKGGMEFLGVRERDVDGLEAVKWAAIEQRAKEVVKARMVKESEAKRMSEVAGETSVSPKKKRGRPTNAERERRAMEIAAQD